MKQLSTLVKRILSRLPTPLPVGMSQFNTWADSIIDLSGEYSDRDSLKFAIATMVMHADAKHGALPKNYFVIRLRKAAANQIAAQVFQDVKQKQVKQAEELAKLQQAADTAVETSNPGAKEA